MHRGFGAYSAMVKADDRQLDPIAGLLEDDATFIRCCLMAAVVGFDAFKETGQTVEVITPSSWVAETFGNAGQLAELRSNKWVQDDGNSIVHSDLFERLAKHIDRQASVEWRLATEVGRAARQRRHEDDDIDEPKSARDCRIRYAATTLGNSGIGAYHIEIEMPRRVETVTAKFQATNYSRANLTACIDALDEARKMLRRDGLQIVIETPRSNDCRRGQSRMARYMEPQQVDATRKATRCTTATSGDPFSDRCKGTKWKWYR